MPSRSNRKHPRAGDRLPIFIADVETKRGTKESLAFCVSGHAREWACDRIERDLELSDWESHGKELWRYEDKHSMAVVRKVELQDPTRLQTAYPQTFY